VLRQLVEKGWKDQGSLELDPDLETVRRDKRFPEIISELKRVSRN
jgi:hypothetical protein